jgi:hypothetical protein
MNEKIREDIEKIKAILEKYDIKESEKIIIDDADRKVIENFIHFLNDKIRGV